MADSFITLGPTQPGTSVGTIYTVPAEKQTIIKHIRVVNTSAIASADIELFQNGSSGPFQILPPVTIAPLGYWESDAPLNFQAAGTFRAKASAADQLTLTAYGLERDDYSTIAHNHDDRYYTETEMDGFLAAKASNADLTTGLAGKAAAVHSHTHGEVHTWTVPGEVKVVQGGTPDTDFINPFAQYKLGNETLTLKKLRGKIRAGTSVTLKLQINGVDVTGYTGLVFTTTEANFGNLDVDIANDDVLAIVVTNVTGQPMNLRVGAAFTRAVT